MDVERSSLCNCVVNFLLEENYLLTAFELLHELLDDGRDAHAIRLKEFFSDPSQFPPDNIARFNSLKRNSFILHLFPILLPDLGLGLGLIYASNLPPLIPNCLFL